MHMAERNVCAQLSWQVATSPAFEFGEHVLDFVAPVAEGLVAGDRGYWLMRCRVPSRDPSGLVGISCSHSRDRRSGFWLADGLEEDAGTFMVRSSGLR
jgi:hypothetical protein